MAFVISATSDAECVPTGACLVTGETAVFTDVFTDETDSGGGVLGLSEEATDIGGSRSRGALLSSCSAPSSEVA
jgi:phosphoribosylaminoimidazole (AIR) synthetase